MNIVGRDQTEPELPRKFWQMHVAFLLVRDAVIVQFDEKVLWSKNVAILGGKIFCFLNVVGLKRAVDFAGETSAQTDQAIGMRRQQCLVDPRSIIKTVEMRRRNQLHQIAVTRFILRQQSEMIGGFA